MKANELKGEVLVPLLRKIPSILWDAYKGSNIELFL